MPRQKKDSVPICYRIERSVYERLQAYAEDKGQRSCGRNAAGSLLIAPLILFKSSGDGMGHHLLSR